MREYAMNLDAKTALIVVDVQNGFTPGGQLAVMAADQIIPCINQLIDQFSNIVLTQDWHTPDHISFAQYHQKQPFDTIELDYGTQTLWPEHCVQGTHDAEFHPELNVSKAQLIIRKGFHQAIDSYSAFMEADRKTKTGLASYLDERGIDTVYITGIATDFCVAWTAIDACEAGFKCYVVEDACKAINLNGSLDAAWETMLKHGVKKTTSEEILHHKS